MSWNSFAKLQRLECGLRFRGQDPEKLTVGSLLRCLSQRTTDQRLNNLVYEMIWMLEPPGCEMTHCKHYGESQSFCNCGLERVAGKCPILRAYRKRKRERQQRKETT